jgi:hypothetical protein
MYAYSLNGEDYHGSFISVGQALAEAEAEQLLDGYDPGDKVFVWVGEIEDAGEYVNRMDLATCLIETIEERLSDEIPFDDVIVSIKTENVTAFDKELKDLIAKHLAYNAFGIVDVVRYTVTVGES